MSSEYLMLGGVRYVTTAEAAAHFAPDVTEDMIRDWTKRGILRTAGRHAGRSNIYRIIDVAAAEQQTRAERRGRKRQGGDLQKIQAVGHNLPTEPLANYARMQEICSVTGRDDLDCTRVSVPDAPFPLCSEHMKLAYLHWLDVQRERYQADPAAPFDARLEPPPDFTARQTFVYYIRFGDRIKIGFSTDVRMRINNLPYDELLALEPGPIELEKMRHRQFIRYRVAGHNEWFHANPQLVSHIEMLVEHYGPAETQLRAEANRRTEANAPLRGTDQRGLPAFPTVHPGAPPGSGFVSMQEPTG